MSALTADNQNIKGPLLGENLVRDLTVYNAEIMYKYGLQAIDYAGETQMASDTLGLKVIGFCCKKVDNTNDGETIDPPLIGIYRISNSSTYPITAVMKGKPAYVEDDNHVAAFSTNLVVAGLIHDVDADGVWLDVRPASMAIAMAQALPKVVAVTGTTATLTAAQCFQGNVVITAENAAGVTLTLPTAQAGYRIGIQRINAGQGYDVVLQAPSGDTVRGSAAAGTATNDTDAVSDILWLETYNGTAWVDAFPLAKDRAEWTASA